MMYREGLHDERLWEPDEKEVVEVTPLERTLMEKVESPAKEEEELEEHRLSSCE